MSKMIKSFDPTVVNPDPNQNTFDSKVTNPCGGMYLFNESNAWLQLRLPGGRFVGLPAWWARFYKFDQAVEPIQWSVLTTIPAATTPPLSEVFGEAYESSELKDKTFYDGPIPRQPYIGNQVSTSVSATNSINNTGNPLGTNWLSVTPSGAGSPTATADNSGNMTLQVDVAGLLTTVFQIIEGGSPVMKLIATGLLLEVLGSLQVDQNLTVNGNETVTGTLGITGNSSLSTLSTSGLATLNSALLNGVLTFINNTPLQWKDNGGTARRVMQVDNNNNTQLFGITGLDLIQMLSSGGVVQMIFDLVNGLLNITGSKQTQNGSTSGTMDVYEVFSGSIKLVIAIQTNYQNSGAAKFITLKTAFTKMAAIFNFGAGSINVATGGAAGSLRQVTWGTGTAAGTQAATTQCNQDAACFSVLGSGFTQVGDSGSYAAAFNGMGIYIGV